MMISVTRRQQVLRQFEAMMSDLYHISRPRSHSGREYLATDDLAVLKRLKVAGYRIDEIGRQFAPPAPPYPKYDKALWRRSLVLAQTEDDVATVLTDIAKKQCELQVWRDW